MNIIQNSTFLPRWIFEVSAQADRNEVGSEDKQVIVSSLSGTINIVRTSNRAVLPFQFPFGHFNIVVTIKGIYKDENSKPQSLRWNIPLVSF